MVPAAPVRFSITTDWPSVRFIRSASTRPSVSVGPPAGNGTTITIGRDGYDCENASRGTIGIAAAAAARPKTLRRMSDIEIPPVSLAREPHRPLNARGLFLACGFLRPPRARPLPLNVRKLGRFRRQLCQQNYTNRAAAWRGCRDVVKWRSEERR